MSFTLTGANRHDVTQLLPLVDALDPDAVAARLRDLAGLPAPSTPRTPRRER